MIESEPIDVCQIPTGDELAVSTTAVDAMNEAIAVAVANADGAISNQNIALLADFVAELAVSDELVAAEDASLNESVAILGPLLRALARYLAKRAARKAAEQAAKKAAQEVAKKLAKEAAKKAAEAAAKKTTVEAAKKAAAEAAKKAGVELGKKVLDKTAKKAAESALSSEARRTAIKTVLGSLAAGVTIDVVIQLLVAALGSNELSDDQRRKMRNVLELVKDGIIQPDAGEKALEKIIAGK